MRPLLFSADTPNLTVPVSVEISARESQEDIMFTDSLLESGWHSGSHRIWTTLTSLSLQALAVGVLLLLPLLYTQGLPRLSLLERLPLPSPPPAPAPVAAERSHSPSTSNIAVNGDIIAPTRIPETVAQIQENTPPPSVGIGNGVLSGTGTRWAANSVLGSIFNQPASVLPPPPSRPATRATRPSSFMEGLLVHRVQPNYPPLARAARIQGSVVLQAVISKGGSIENLQVLSGHPMLVRSAIEAVQQWRYRPYLLNGEAVEVETQITVHFILSGG